MRYLATTGTSTSPRASPHIHTSKQEREQRCKSGLDILSLFRSSDPANEELHPTIDLLILSLTMSLTVLLSTNVPTLHIGSTFGVHGHRLSLLILSCSLCYNFSALVAYGYSQALYEPQCCATCAAATIIMVVSSLLESEIHSWADRSRC